jgi:DNA phosphorothioation system restriction enzyme
VLADLGLEIRYRSNEHNLLEDFYLPCLREAEEYDRAVGFFSSYALSAAAAGLPPFIHRGGRMRLVASPELSPDDADAIAAGYRARDDVIEEALLRALDTANQPDPIKERLGFLAWLIAEKLLEIKIALVTADGQPGIYHEKIGIFKDADEDKVVFQGSANESLGGLVANFESVYVFRSWVEAERERTELLAADFDQLWQNRTRNLEVFDFPDAAKQELLRLRPRNAPQRDPYEPPEDAPEIEAEKPPPAEPQLPAGLTVRDYQRDAMRAWFKADGRGLLQMATGTGKTVVALATSERLYDAFRRRNEPLLAIVLCPLQHLVTQWAEAARDFGMRPVLCFQSRQRWFDDLAGLITDIGAGYSPFGIAIATNATFQSDDFQALLARAPANTMLIVDEVHNVGASKLRTLLPEHIRFRLGLSATPERWYDDEGTTALRDYFGDVVYELGLEQAIGLGALTPYDYYPEVVYLYGAELEDYLELTEKISRLATYEDAAFGSESENPALRALLVRRARILASASGKLPVLRRVVEPFRATTHNLFYCGDGRVEDDTGHEGIRQIDAVVRLLGRDAGMHVNSYTQENYLQERDVLRERFAAGSLQGLVAIRCLDEGVDIPETRRAFILASSTNPRQFIQRRGRILRLSPESGKTSASIHDFLVVPPPDAVEPSLMKAERRLVQRELTRVALFAKLARNGPQAMGQLEDLRKRYDLLHVA